LLVNWCELTKNQFDRYRGNSVVAINFASTEQHSNYLPVGTDRILGEAVLQGAAKLAESNVLVMPTVCYGYSPHHRFAPGYVTIGQSTLIAYCRDIMQSVCENGFDKLVILNSHGGNMAYLQCAVNEIGERYEENLHVALFKYWDLIADRISEIRESKIGGMGHAGEFETSLMMYLRPDLVDTTLIKEYPPAQADPYYEPDLIGRRKYVRFISFNKYSVDGNMGQASFASTEKGKTFFDLATRATAEFLDFWCTK